MPRPHRGELHALGGLLLVLAAGVSSAGCGEGELFSEAAPAAVKVKQQEGARVAPDRDPSLVPVPPEDGPKLAATALITPVRARPEPGAAAVGYLRVGAKVARSERSLGTRDCRGGWYAVRPVGFVCAEKDATTRLDHPVVRALGVEPDRTKPMPYKYAFVRAIAPNYLRIPTTEEQHKYEMRLERHLRNWKKLTHEWDKLDVGANDVPLDERGLANGPIPPDARPMDMNERFGGDGSDEVPWWLRGERRIPNLSTFRAPPYAVIADRIKRHAGVALIGTFVAGPRAGGRRFAISTDGRLLPADKLKADSGSPFHGRDIREVGLPIAFARKAGATYWKVDGGTLERAARLGVREFIPLTGKVRRIRGVRMVEARSGLWVRSEDVKTAAKPSQLPWFARHRTKWIDISILNQIMVLWEGATPVYSTLISTGRDGLGDPAKTLSTPTGTFRIYQKHVTTKMDSDAADDEFELRDVPWVMYFKGGYAVHAAYWHDDFGRARSHGCINLSPIDARYTFLWADPPVPEHWHAAYSGDAFGDGTLVHIHP